MEQSAEQNDIFERAVAYSAIFLLLIFLSGITAISAGLFDPEPLGQLSHSEAPGTFAAKIGQASAVEYDLLAAPRNGTIRLSATVADGPASAAYGILLGTFQSPLLVAVSPSGYVAIGEWSPISATEDAVTAWHLQHAIMPWQTWPHILPADRSNEIWIDIEQGTVTAVRINRELLWKGQQHVAGNQLRLWIQPADGSTVIAFDSFEIWTVSEESVPVAYYAK